MECIVECGDSVIHKAGNISMRQIAVGSAFMKVAIAGSRQATIVWFRRVRVKLKATREAEL